MNIKHRLQVMMFFQYFIWGSWLTTFGIYLINTLHFSGYDVGLVYSTKGFAALIMPFIIGIIADKFIHLNTYLCFVILFVLLRYFMQPQ